MKPVARPGAPRRLFRAALLAASLSALLSPVLGGCAASVSQIEQGQAISTGKEPYDAFFEAVRDLRSEAATTGDEAAAARADLMKSLGLEEKADADETVDAARARAAKLKEAGILLHLVITPEAKLLIESGKTPVASGDKTVLDAVEASAKSSLDVSRRLGELTRRAAELEEKRAALAAESSATFAQSPGKQRDEVARELDASARVLVEAAERGGKQAGLASKFVLDLAAAIETGASAKPSKPSRRWGGSRPRGSPPPRGAPPAAGQPPPKPAGGGDDFDP